MSIKPQLVRGRDGKERLRFEMSGEASMAARITIAQEWYEAIPQVRSAMALGGTITLVHTRASLDVLSDALALALGEYAKALVVESPVSDTPPAGAET